MLSKNSVSNAQASGCKNLSVSVTIGGSSRSVFDLNSNPQPSSMKASTTVNRMFAKFRKPLTVFWPFLMVFFCRLRIGAKNLAFSKLFGHNFIFSFGSTQSVISSSMKPTLTTVKSSFVTCLVSFLLLQLQQELNASDFSPFAN